MLKDRGEPVATWQCILKYAARLENCHAPYGGENCGKVR